MLNLTVKAISSLQVFLVFLTRKRGLIWPEIRNDGDDVKTTAPFAYWKCISQKIEHAMELKSNVHILNLL